MFKFNAARLVVCLAGFLIWGTLPGVAQVQTGGMQGVVTDNSGAAVPGATVTITDVDTGSARQLTTDSQGRFAVSSLMIGNYKVQVTMNGFASQARENLVLTIGQILAVDFQLQVGAVTQQVTVASTASQIDTTTSQTGTLVGSNQLQELPLNGRNYEQLVALAPGVAPSQSTPSGGANFGDAQRYSIAGTRVDAGSILLDGVQIRGFWGDQAGLNITGTSLGVSSIAEFQVITNSANAEYNDVSVISEVTRSGTNNFHGSAYGYFRNSAMDDRNFYDPASGPPAFHRYQFGGAVGGPIQKNKTFFFVNYEGIRASLALHDTEDVPDTNAHAGIINGVHVGVSPAIAPYLALYPNYGAPGGPPLPPEYTDNPTTGIASFITIGDQPQTENYIAVKLDHQISVKNNFSARVVSDRGVQVDPWFGGNIAAAPGLIAFPGVETDPEANSYTTLQDRHIFSPNLINVATFAFVRTSQKQTVNLADVPAPMLQFNSLGEPGSIAIGGVASIPAPAYEPLQQIQHIFTEQDEVDWVHGAHTFAFGGGVSRIECNCVQASNAGGAWTFPSLAGFLQNQPNLYQGEFPASGLTGYQASIRYGRQTNISVFIEDNWRVTRRLTLNMGIRDDFITNPVEAKNNFYAIDKLNPFTCSNNPACDGGTPEAGVSTGFTHNPNMFRNNPSTRNIDPRIGFAWDIFGNGKTALRGAYGVYHDLIYPHFYTVGSGFGYPNGTTQINSFGGATGTFPAVNPKAIVPQIRTVPDYNDCCTPYYQEWNLAVEQQLPAHLLLTAAYVGSNGIHLYEQQNYNTQIPVAGTQFRPFSPAKGATLAGCGSACTQGYGQNGAGYTPNVAFTSVQFFNPEGTSNYNSGIVSVARNLGNSIQLFSAFTWARCLDYGSVTTGGPELGNDSTLYVYPLVNKKYNYGPCAFNIAKNWTSNALIPLPFHGNQLAEGWEFGVIETAHTGNPVTPGLNAATDQNNLGQYVFDTERPNLNPNFTGPFYIKQKTFGSVPRVNWFNPSAYQIGPLGELGNASRGIINGPNLIDLDLSLMKTTKLSKLGEGGALQIRGDFFNSLNHPNFSLPNSTIFNGVAGGPILNPVVSTITTTSTEARQVQLSATVDF